MLNVSKQLHTGNSEFQLHEDEERIDIAIIGAGPAGLSTAMHLVQQDPTWAKRLVVFEKKSHPRHKVCGGGITQLGLRQLLNLGFRLDIPYVSVETVKFQYQELRIDLKGKPIMAVVRRSEFDAWLADQARRKGIRILENTPALDLMRQGDEIRVTTPEKVYIAKTLVGADGSLGIVRRWLSRFHRSSKVARLLEIVTPTTRNESEFKESSALFDFSWTRDKLQGYYWDFPSLIKKRPHINSGVYDSRVVGTRPRASLMSPLHERFNKRGFRIQKENLEGHPIYKFKPTNTFSGQNVLLVGDAAGADPLFGEGIGIALAYGERAASTLIHAFSRKNFQFKAYRKRILFSALGRYLLLRWLIASIVYRHSGRDVVMRFLWRLGHLLEGFIGRSLRLKTEN